MEACCVQNCHCHSRRRRAKCVGIEMKQYRMQNRYTNHLPSHFYCRHGIDLNLSCSLCINEECQTRALAERQPPMPSIGSFNVCPHAPAELCNQGGGELRQTRPMGFNRHPEGAGCGNSTTKPSEKITAEQINEVISYSQETGLFTWVKNQGRARIGDVVSYKDSYGYIAFKLYGHLRRAHRVAWFLTHGSFPDGDIDHINRDRSDNRIKNLRCVSRSENMENQLLRSDNKSGFKGVFFEARRNKWRADIAKDKKSKHIGYFDTAEAAFVAYQNAAAKFHTINPVAATGDDAGRSNAGNA